MTRMSFAGYTTKRVRGPAFGRVVVVNVVEDSRFIHLYAASDTEVGLLFQLRFYSCFGEHSAPDRHDVREIPMTCHSSMAVMSCSSHPHWLHVDRHGSYHISVR